MDVLTKKVLGTLFFFLLILIPLSTFAQNKLQLGPIVGVGVASMSDNYDHKNFHTGILSSFVLSPRLNLQPALLVSSKWYADTFIKADKEVELNYIDLITTLKYTPWKYFFMGIGVQAGYLLKASYSYLAYGTDYYDRINLTPYANKMDVGVNLKLGCRFDSGIGLEISYIGGLIDVFDDNLKSFKGNNWNTVTIPIKGRGKNTVISTSFYFLFGLRPNKNLVAPIN